MRLSEAIRLGSMSTQQAFCFFHSPSTILTREFSAVMYACALGAAGLAVGETCTEDLAKVYPILHKIACWPDGTFTNITVDGQLRSAASVAEIIITLNDNLKWSRERIADWVESIEIQQGVASDVAAKQEVAVTA